MSLSQLHLVKFLLMLNDFYKKKFCSGITSFSDGFEDVFSLLKAVGFYVAYLASSLIPTIYFAANFKFSCVFFLFYVCLGCLESMVLFIPLGIDHDIFARSIVCGAWYILAALFAFYGFVFSIVSPKGQKEDEKSLSLAVFIWLGLAFVGVGLFVFVAISTQNSTSHLGRYTGIEVACSVLLKISLTFPFLAPLFVMRKSLRNGELKLMFICNFPLMFAWPLAFMSSIVYAFENVVTVYNVLFFGATGCFLVSSIGIVLEMIILLRSYSNIDKAKHENEALILSTSQLQAIAAGNSYNNIHFSYQQQNQFTK